MPVYVMKSDNTGLYKIGRSEDVDQRLRAFKTVDPSIKLVAVIETDTPDQVEATLHRRFQFQQRWINHEWYALRPRHVRYLLARAQRAKSQRPWRLRSTLMSLFAQIWPLLAAMCCALYAHLNQLDPIQHFSASLTAWLLVVTYLLKRLRTPRGRVFAIALLAALPITSPVNAQEPQPTGTPELMYSPTPTATMLPLPWHGFILLEINTAIFPTGLDDAMLDAIRSAFSAIAPADTQQASHALQIGPVNLERTAIIIEARWNIRPTQEIAVQALAARLDLPPEHISIGITLRLFPQNGGTWAESASLVREYLRTASGFQYPRGHR